MALPLNDIYTDDVRDELGESTDDVGELCISPNINMWALHKPASAYAPDVQVLGSGIKSHGIHRKYPSINEMHYNRPKGGDDYYFLDAFSLYNHVSVAPVAVTIVSVTELTTNTVLSSPYTFIKGFEYRIKFSLLAGEIDPETIYDQTVRTKNTDLGGGYGGLVIAQSGLSNVESNDVVSCPVTNKEIDMICVVSSGKPFHFFYCAYSGFEDAQYSTTEFLIEDESFLNNFSAALIDMDITFTKIWWDPIAGLPQVSINIGNNTGRAFNDLRVKFVYSSTGSSGTIYDLGVNVPTTGGSASAFMEIGSNGPGDHTYSVTAYLEIYNNNHSTWQTLKQASSSGTVTIPAG